LRDEFPQENDVGFPDLTTPITQQHLGHAAEQKRKTSGTLPFF
jgi:hypothetical protein